MSVFVEITSSLGRRLTVSVPAPEVTKAIKSQLTRLAQKAKIPGFRPGKIPPRVIEQRFGGLARGEAIEELLQSSLRQALIEEKLQPAETPTVQSLKADPDMPLEYTATFEIYPQVQLRDLTDVKLEKWVVSITEDDVSQVLGQMRKMHVTWEETSRPAEFGDRLTADLQGLNQGEPIAELTEKNTFLILDEAALPPGFSALIGAQVGDTVTIELPKESSNVSQAQVFIHKIEQAKLPELDAEFAKKMGLADGNAEALQAEVRKHIEQELAQLIKSRLKAQIIDALLAHHSIELPRAMVDEEFQQMEKDLRARVKEEAKQKNNVQLSKADREKLLVIARQRVTLGLLFPAIIKAHDIKLDSDLVTAQLERLKSAFENAEDMLGALTNDKNLMMRIQSQVLEDQVVERLLQQVRFTEKTLTYSEALQLSQEEKNGHTHRHHPPDAPVR
jgi:trigger factor